MYTVIRQKYALHKISRGWLAYLMQHGPFMVHQVFANENRRGQWYKIIRCHSTEGHWNKLRVSLSVLDAAVEIKWTTMRQHEKSEGKNTQTIERLEFQPKIQQSPTLQEIKWLTERIPSSSVPTPWPNRPSSGPRRGRCIRSVGCCCCFVILSTVATVVLCFLFLYSRFLQTFTPSSYKTFITEQTLFIHMSQCSDYCQHTYLAVNQFHYQILLLTLHSSPK